MYISSPPPSIVKVLIDVVVAGCANIFTKGFSHRVKTNPPFVAAGGNVPSRLYGGINILITDSLCQLLLKVWVTNCAG
jgi:hypothetical protein